jgi:uncharacterized membrane protein YoaK (UPF0700 family)
VPHRSPARAARRRDALVVVLTLSAGAVDAATFLRLGNVFSSVVTGNLVLLGIAAGRRAGSLARSGGLALVGYAVGVLLGGMLAGTFQRDQPIWPFRVTVTLTAELAAMAGLAAGWLITGGRPTADGRLWLLALAAVAMGIQTAAVRRLGQMSSTYLTSTLAGLVTGLAVRRWPADWQRSAGTLLGLVIGAMLGALTATQAPAWLPVVILSPLAAVTAAALAVFRQPG